LGETENPTGGGVLDRITSESRLAPLVALARQELSQGDFVSIVDRMLSESKSATTPGGIGVERLPFFGTALEIFAQTFLER
jgi:hypothetical protein